METKTRDVEETSEARFAEFMITEPCNAIVVHKHGMTLCSRPSYHNDYTTPHEGTCPEGSCAFNDPRYPLVWKEMFERWLDDGQEGTSLHKD